MLISDLCVFVTNLNMLEPGRDANSAWKLLLGSKICGGIKYKIISQSDRQSRQLRCYGLLISWYQLSPSSESKKPLFDSLYMSEATRKSMMPADWRKLLDVEKDVMILFRVSGAVHPQRWTWRIFQSTVGYTPRSAIA